MENTKKKGGKTWLWLLLAVACGMVGGYALGTGGTFKMYKKPETKTPAQIAAETAATAQGLPPKTGG